MDKALRQLLLAPTDELYVQSLRHKYIGYRKTNTRALLDHLYYTYANISATTLQDNDKKLRAPYNINQPFETLINQVENAVDYASEGDMPYTLAKVVGIAFQLVFQTGLFNNNYKLWQHQPADVNSWTHLKEFFPTSHQEWH